MKKDTILIMSIILSFSVVALTCGTISGSNVMDQDLTSSGTCFTITALSTTLDCAGFKITGNPGTVGVNINGAGNFNVKNCNITNFARGMDIVNNARNGNVFENYFSNSQYDIDIRAPSFTPRDNNIFNNTFNKAPRQQAGTNIVWDNNYYVFYNGSTPYIGDGFTDNNPSFGEQNETPEYNYAIFAIMAAILAFYTITRKR